MAPLTFLSWLSASLLLVQLLLAGPTRLHRRAGSVPTLDGSPSPFTSNGLGEYVRITRINDGSLVAGFTEQDGSQSVLKTAKSTDNGATWSNLGEVFRGDSATHDIDNAYPIQLPNSDSIAYFYRNHDRQANGPYNWFRISSSISDDGGITFRYLATVDERAPNPTGPNGIWEPYVRVAMDGSTLQCYYSSENNAGDQDSLMKTSSDGGKTWSGPQTIGGGDVISRDGMLGVAPTDNNGGLIAVFEQTPDGKFSVGSVKSSDDGKTWGNRQTVFEPSGVAGSPQVVNVWGTIVVIFNTNEDTVLPSYSAANSKVMTSTDGGNTWSNKLTVLGQSDWPGLMLLDQSSFLVTAHCGSQGAVSQKVTLS